MKKILKVFIFILMIIPATILAAPEKPPGSEPGNNGSNNSSFSYSGKNMITSNTNESEKTYSSTTGGENALLVSGGTSTINSCMVTKTGDSDGDNSDFYGTNAAILAYNGATLNIKGGTITTNGSHANAVFAYGSGIINVSDATIETKSNNSGGVMVTGGGTLTATGLTVKTAGNSSAAIRSDRGGGTLTVNNGTYGTSGMGSPAIYSTANIIVNQAKLTSTSSEGVVVEGANSVALNGVELTDTNTTLNGNSETYKNIFLYQSMSGDAESGTASFTAKDSTIVTNKGDTIFVTNTTATISLENNTITNNDGDFLRIQTGKWGNSGSNGGNVTLKMINQKVKGNIIVDSISTLDLTLSDGSVLQGAIDSSNQAKKVSLTISENSVLSLTGNTYVDKLTNEKSDNSNIYLNGYKLYVNGKEIKANDSTYDDTSDVTTIGTDSKVDTIVKKESKINIYYVLGFIAVATSLVVAIILVIKKKNKIK